MARLARSTFRLAERKSQWLIGFLPAAVLCAMAFQPIPAVAAQLRCASDSLNRNEIARAQAVARPALPASSQLAVAFACWNPDFARVGLETPKALTPDGVQQWWSVACQRDESTWACEPPEFNQFISANLPVRDQSHPVELSFGRGIALERARELASRALSIYADPASRLRDCGTIEDSPKGPVGMHRSDKQTSADEPFHVNVIRDGLMDSVWLDDVDVSISFDPAGKQSPCWLDIVVVD